MKRILFFLLLLAIIIPTVGSAAGLKGLKDNEAQSIVIGRFDKTKIIDSEKYYAMHMTLSEAFPKRFELYPYGSNDYLRIKTQDGGFFAVVTGSGIHDLQIDRKGTKVNKYRKKYKITRFLVPKGQMLNIGTYNMMAIDLKREAEGNIYSYKMVQGAEDSAFQEPIEWFKVKYPDVYKAYESRLSTYKDKQEPEK